ncbi:Disheveled-associated activator of morphogenesis 2 [Gossypium arboreum]|uniref:Disheveled-associated activator of morphogenesis 2 n=1 Tax=Gossypium arboreum TaxID=29729 RepID=A0A0B0N673_GOSAR|nr:Disheveled-associated activator of morphogenesis 2 [Gossypium arboreum]
MRRVQGRTLLKDLYDLNPVECVKERFSSEVSDDYIKKALGKKWRDHKSTLKKQYFKKDISLEEKLSKCPAGNAEDHERIGTSNRKKQKSTYMTGSRSFAFVAEAEEKLKEKKAKYEAIASTDSFVNLENIDNRIITAVLGPERYGRVRFQGSGVTPTQYFGSGSQQYMPSGS